MELIRQNTGEEVAELQGLYAPFTFPELLLQKIWARRDFALNRARLQDGRELKVRFPGTWNRLGGPDFQDARLVIDGVEVDGDVEVHLNERGWHNHRHKENPAYDRVVLHVVLFVPEHEWTLGAKGRNIPILALLPLLHKGVEEYANEDAIERIRSRTWLHNGETLKEMEEDSLWDYLLKNAVQRFARKVHYAKERLRMLGWEAACHHTALEILGYRKNRAPMLGVASEFPLSEWRAGRVSTAAVFELRRDCWELQGLRPVNHPTKRLWQYMEWVSSRKDWPTELVDMVSGLPQSGEESTDTRAFRKAHDMEGIQGRFVDLCGGVLGGTRLHNMICDGFLPLLAAETGAELKALWLHWFCGDCPASFKALFRELPGCRGKVFCYGAGQGILAHLMEKEAEFSRF